MKLIDLPDGAHATVAAVLPRSPELEPGDLRRLGELGFIPGERVMVTARGFPGGDPLVEIAEGQKSVVAQGGTNVAGRQVPDHQLVAPAHFTPGTGRRPLMIEGQHFVVFHHQQFHPWVIVEK